MIRLFIYGMVCSGLLSHTDALCGSWTGFSSVGYLDSIQYGERMSVQCNPGCYVTTITLWVDGNVHGVQLTCSDGGITSSIGCTSGCVSSPTNLISSSGFNKFNIYYGNDVNGVGVNSVSGNVYSYAGCDRCQTKAYSTGAFLVGVEIYYKGDPPPGRGSKNSVDRMTAYYSDISCSSVYYVAGGNCIACTGCASGKYMQSCAYGGASTCIDSPAGGYSPGGLTALWSCCSAGSYSGPAAGACSTCPDGKFAASVCMGGCSDCATGYTSTSDHTGCSPCSTTPRPGQYFSSSCNIDLCPVNTYSASGSVTMCTPCPSNANSASGSSICKCNDGYYGTTSCDLCPAGFACLNGVKTACNPGQYSPSGSAGCTSCLAGTYAGASASTSCGACNAGSVSIAAASRCTLCDPGNHAASPGQASPCSACLPGTYASGSGLATCPSCAVGKYSGASYSVTCTDCAAGTYATGTGFDNPNNCIACNPGSFSPTAAASTCQLCIAGKYSDSSSSQVCSPCLSGLTYASTSGSVICTQCSAPTCSAGNGLVTCTTTTDARCVACAVIPLCTYTTGGTCTDSNGVALCNCVSGYQLSSGACSLCPAGKFKPLANSAACAAWTVTSCNAGFYLSNGNAFHDSECVACPPLPSNTAFDTAAGGCSWRCLAGFNNSVAGLV